MFHHWEDHILKFLYEIIKIYLKTDLMGLKPHKNSIIYNSTHFDYFPIWPAENISDLMKKTLYFDTFILWHRGS